MKAFLKQDDLKNNFKLISEKISEITNLNDILNGLEITELKIYLTVQGFDFEQLI